MKRLFSAIIFLFILCLSTTAFAHGVKITQQTKTIYELSAAFDTGEKLAGAQVTIFAPDKPSTPWATGVCDQNGHYIFTPDFSKPGNWSVQVRQAGHGGLIHIPISENMAASETSTGYSTLQIIVMAVCVIWGLIGTALFFSRKKVL